MTRIPAPSIMLMFALCAAAACGGSSSQSAPAQQVGSSGGAEAVSLERTDVTRARSGQMTGAPTVSADAEAESVQPAVEYPTQPTPMPVTGGPSDEYDALLDADRDLGGALGLATVDCGSARDLRDRICDLSARICDLARAGDQDTRARCEDGATRCARASRRVAASCPE